MIEINQDNFETWVLKADLPILIEFGAEWCAPCKRLEPELQKLESEWSGKINLGHINVDQDPDLAMTYNVMGVPTVILVKGGEVVERMTGFKPLPKLKEIFGKHLD